MAGKKKSNPVKQVTNRGGKFRPGESGNPKGRPPAEKAITNVLRSRMDAEHIAATLLSFVDDEDRGLAFKACQYIINRLEGMPAQSVQAVVTAGSIPEALKAELINIALHDNA